MRSSVVTEGDEGRRESTRRAVSRDIISVRCGEESGGGEGERERRVREVDGWGWGGALEGLGGRTDVTV